MKKFLIYVLKKSFVNKTILGIISFLVYCFMFNNYLKINLILIRSFLSLYREQNWPEFFLIWNKFPKDDHSLISKKLYIYISRVFFEVYDYYNAAYYLKQYENRYKLKTYGLRLRKDIFYRWAIYSRNIKISKGVPILDEIDETNNRPDWQTVSIHCLNYLRHSNKNDYSECFQEYIHSCLFCVEELLIKNDFIKAETALRNAFKIIVSDNGIDAFSGKIINYIKQTFSSDKFKDKANDSTYKLICDEEASLYTAIGWFAIYDLLCFHGFLKSAAAARVKAIESLYLDAEKNPLDFSKVKWALLASIDMSDFDKAEYFFNNYSILKKDKQVYDGLYSYYLMNIGETARAKNILRKYFTRADKVFSNYINGKTVAVVGPAPNGEQLGDEIDSYDIVIRFTYLGKRSMPDPDEFGEKINITLYANSSLKYILDKSSNTFLEDLDFYFIKDVRTDYISSDVKKFKAIKIKKNKYLAYKLPIAVPVVLFHLLHFYPSRIKIFKSNFFLSQNPYDPNYLNKNDINKHRKKLPNSLAMFTFHDVLSQTHFVNNIFRAGLIEVDNNCEEVLSLTDEEYMIGMEKVI